MPETLRIVKDMGIEQSSEHIWRVSPGVADVHTHPRIYDAITNDGFVTLNHGDHGPQEGKAGLRHYTEVALRSGITVMIAMPNESIRRLDLTAKEQTSLTPYPIASLDRVIGVQGAINTDAMIPTAIHMGLDPETAFRDSGKTRLNTGLLEKEFTAVSDECTSLKVYLAETTGGYNIALEHAIGVADVWYRTNPGKPIVYHVEGADVAKLLTGFNSLRLGKGQRNWGKEQPIHIAHVSSREELEAVIAAKEAGMNVTCEVTPHHLFMNDADGSRIGGSGCMKPGLKSQADVDYLWANIDKIDIIASDCAPHRHSDKEAPNPAYGVTNHTALLPLMLGAVAQGKLTMDQLYDKMCVKPRQRFGLPLEDESRIIIDTSIAGEAAEYYEDRSGVRYEANPFTKMNSHALMVGRVIFAQAGESFYHPQAGDSLQASYKHLLTPKNIATQALINASRGVY